MGKELSKRQKAVIVPAMVLVGTGAVALSVFGIVNMTGNSASKYGIGAGGFSAFAEENGDMGVANVINKDEVQKALASNAKDVADVDVSKVFNLNGDRGQTATFAFTRKDGVKSSVYVDARQFKSAAALKSAGIYVYTASAGNVKDHPAYYTVSQNIGGIREYSLMVVNDLKVFRFVMEQPAENATIGEVPAVATLLKVAKQANYDI